MRSSEKHLNFTRDRQSGREVLQTLGLTEHLARIFNKSNRKREALKLLIQVLEMRMKVQGLSHPDTASSEASLASTYTRLGYIEEANLLERSGDYAQITEQLLVNIMSSRRPEAVKFTLKQRWNKGPDHRGCDYSGKNK